MTASFKTPLHEAHVRLGARMTEFALWEMPLFFHDIRSEHKAVREAAGLFDLSHMGRIEVTGAGRAAFLDALSANRLSDLTGGRARYTVFCDESGGCLDDLVVFCEAERMWVVPNASNREAILAWLKSHASGFKVQIADRSLETSMLALQGPRAAEILATAGVKKLEDFGRFRLRAEKIFKVPVVLSRTGYTGEDGFEIIVPAEKAEAVWTGLLAAGKRFGIQPAGLGARDTLRLEAALMLYGHELTREITPVEAGLLRFVKFKDRRFVGREKLLSQVKNAGAEDRRLVGLVIDSRRIPRSGQEILSEGRIVGAITSGTSSPTLETSIALGYVPLRLAVTGTALVVRVSHEDVPAAIVPIPFYARRK